MRWKKNLWRYREKAIDFLGGNTKDRYNFLKILMGICIFAKTITSL